MIVIGEEYPGYGVSQLRATMLKYTTLGVCNMWRVHIECRKSAILSICPSTEGKASPPPWPLTARCPSFYDLEKIVHTRLLKQMEAHAWPQLEYFHDMHILPQSASLICHLSNLIYGTRAASYSPHGLALTSAVPRVNQLGSRWGARRLRFWLAHSFTTEVQTTHYR